MEGIKITKSGVSKTKCQQIVNSVCSDITQMAFGSGHVLSQESLHYFTDKKKRKTLDSPESVWCGGNARYPIINRQTGETCILMNTDLISLATDAKIVDQFKELYGTDNIILAQGPPSAIVKPLMADESNGQVFFFNKKVKIHTGFLCLTDNDENKESGQIEVIENFNLYYDLLDKYFNFNSHCKRGEVLHLEQWFDISNANRFIETITRIYNTEFRNKQWKGPKVSKDIYDIYNIFADNENFSIPEFPKKLEWIRLKCPRGKMFIFDNKTAIRTTGSKDNKVRIYLPIAYQPDSAISSYRKKLLKQYYSSGKIGDWAKPGVRHYTRANKKEYSWRKTADSLKNFINFNWTKTQKSLLGISNDS